MGLWAWVAGPTGCASCGNSTENAATRSAPRAVADGKAIDLADGRLRGSLNGSARLLEAWSGIAEYQGFEGAGEAALLHAADNRSSKHLLDLHGTTVHLIANELLETPGSPFEQSVRRSSRLHDNATTRRLPLPPERGRVVQVVFRAPELATYVANSSDSRGSEATYVLGALYYVDPTDHVFQISLRAIVPSHQYPSRAPELDAGLFTRWLAQFGQTIRPGRPSGSSSDRRVTFPFENEAIDLIVPAGWLLQCLVDDEIPIVRILRPAVLGRTPPAFVEVERGIAEPSEGPSRRIRLFEEEIEVTVHALEGGETVLEYVEVGEELSLAVRIGGEDEDALQDALDVAARLSRQAQDTER